MDENGSRARRGKRALLVLVVTNVIYAGLLVALAVTPRPPESSGVSAQLAHAVAYGVQAVLLFSVLDRALPTGQALVAGGFVAVAFGALTEGLQLLQPTRHSEFADIVADGCGALIACAVVALLHRVWRKMGRGA